MSKTIRWLSSEIDRWVSEKIVSREQADRIRALYPGDPAGISWGLVVFSSIGAVVAGLGIILLFAHNWHAIPRFGKLGIVFGALAAAHAGGLSVARGDRWRRQLGEALCVLGTMAFGAGIWLVAQIYNIDEHFPEGFLIWGLGALAMAWAMGSVPQAVLATVLLVIWNGSERFGFDAPVNWAPLLVVAGLVPLAWRLRSILLMVLVLIALYTSLLFNESSLAGELGAWQAAYALSAFLVAMGFFLADDPSTATLQRLMASFGAVLFFLGSYVRSFESAGYWSGGAAAAPGAEGHSYHLVAAIAYHWLPFALAIAAWAWLFVRVLRGARGLVQAGDWIYPIALVYSEIFAASAARPHPYGVAAPAGAFAAYGGAFLVFNLVCLVLAIGQIVRGCRDGRFRQTVRGSLMFAAIVLARYFDLPGSLAARGLVFIVLGGVLFAEGFYYRRLLRAHGGAGPA